MGFLSGKRALIVGLASNRSIAWGVSRAMLREGAELAFSYPNEKMGERVSKMATECNSDIVLPCDVSGCGIRGKWITGGVKVLRFRDLGSRQRDQLIGALQIVVLQGRFVDLPGKRDLVGAV